MRSFAASIVLALLLASFTAAAQEEAPAVESAAVATDGGSASGLLANVPYQKGHLHIFASLGYALPVIDLDGSSGALPIRIGAHYFVIDSLGVGLKMVFSPVLGMDPSSMFLFNLQGEALYLFKFGLGIYASLGLSTVSTTVDMSALGMGEVKNSAGMFGMALGASYNLFLTKQWGIEAGFEFDFNFNGDGSMIYPLFFVGGKFSLGPFGG